MNQCIIKMKDVSIEYVLKKYSIPAVREISLDIKKGKITALVGESGSGKTTISSALIGCIPEPGILKKGEIIFYEKDKEIRIDKLNHKELNKFRWEKTSMVFQAAQSALNPVMTIRQHFYETLDEHVPSLSGSEKERKCIEILEYVQLNPQIVLDSYPHELSGGMKQRVMIAFSLILDPDLIILDEPTTALDVITQSYIFSLLKKINQEKGVSMLLMTHDISVVARFADYVGVMYGGRLMEYGDVDNVFTLQNNPYTEGLIRATPSIIGPIDKMKPIDGNPPDLLNLPKGCVFNPRCPYCKQICKIEEPNGFITSNSVYCKCHFTREERYHE